MSQINLFTNKEEEKVYSNKSTWARLVKKRDGLHCVNETTFPNRKHEIFRLEAHHIFPKKLKEYGGGKNILKNGVSYCQACHAAEHPEFQTNFIGVFKKQIIFIKDLLGRLVGMKPELQYYRLLEFLTGSLSFRLIQKKIIKTIVEKKKHVLAVMPTGSGKSILYQIPGLLNNFNPSLVISPLKALQLDQVGKLMKNWVPATFINGDLTASEVDERMKNIKEGIFPFVFIHPKQLLVYHNDIQQINFKFHKPLTQVPFDYLVVDEVHTIKSQGLSFTKEYSHLDKIYEHFNRPQMILLTATASKRTRQFIIENLHLNDDNFEEFVTGFYRPEISLEVHRTNYFDQKSKKFISKDEKLIELLQLGIPGKKIIFCTTIKQVDTVYQGLVDKDYRVSRYHSRLNNDEKELNFKVFTGKIPTEETDIMVATSAFGMGVDIKNIRQIIHYSLPFSLTDYYQQFGRAARNGESAVAQLLYDEKESTNTIDYINTKELEKEGDEKTKKLMEEISDEERESLLGYINSENKWQYILDYFGETKQSKVSEWIGWLTLLVFILIIFLLLNS